MSPVVAFGQLTATQKADSARQARARITDSLKAVREHAADSIKTVRQHRADSIQAVRQHKADSVAALTRYKNSKKYKDSVARARKGTTSGKGASAKGKSVVASPAAARADSMREARKIVADSIAAVRKNRTDSVRTAQKHRSDSLGRVQKYKTSKRYADSVTIVRRHKSDSLKAVRKDAADNIAAIRKHSMDSAKGVRQHATDSIKTVRTKHMDSLKVVRKAKTDSLAKAKGLKDKLAKDKVKKKEDAMKLKLEIKLKQKREAWTNKSMLKKNWTPVRALTQNSFTHYNYYYNANRKMEEAELNMRRARKESYDSLINLFPFDPNKDSSLMASDMDSIIHKVSVGIQIHDPRVKWAGDMYLLLGQAYYYKGSYENAAIAFQYIIAGDQAAKRKSGGRQVSIVNNDNHSLLAGLKHKSVHNEAILWLARTYTTAHQLDNTNSILSLLESDQKLPADLVGKVAVEKAFAYLTDRNYDAASAQLDIVVADAHVPEWLRLRAAYLNGQLKQNQEAYLAASESFERALDFYPKIEMDFYTRKNIAYNKLMASNDAATAMVPLKKILNDGKYSGYYDQVYYVLGRLAVKANKPEEAISYLGKSAATPKASKKQKALSFAALGDVYYNTARYNSAKLAYDSAAKYASSASKDPAMAAAVQRSKALTEISAPGKVIHDQDSLLEMARLSKREQQQVARAYIRMLEKQRMDSITAAESAGINAAKDEAAEAGADASSWYFANPTLMAQGNADFKRKWGNRPLVDNWRRQQAIPLTATLAQDKRPADDERDDDVAAGLDESGLPSEATLLARVPNTAPQKEASLKQIQKAYMQMAKAYYTQLEDYNQTLHTLDTLDARFPDHNMKEDELYLRYQVAIKQNQLDKAKQIAQDFVARFPTSQYAAKLKPNMSESALAGEKALKSAADYFDETYKLMQQHQYTEVLMRVDLARKQYNHPRFNKRFDVLEASAYAGKGDYAMADSLLSKFIKANATDTLAGWARNVQDYVKQVRNGGKPAWYDEAMKVAAAKEAARSANGGVDPTGADGLKPATPPPPSVPVSPRFYSYQPDSEHYCVVVLPGLDSRTAVLKQSMRAFDKAKDSTTIHEVLIDFFDITQAVMVVRPFKNAGTAKDYMAALMASAAFSGYREGELRTVIISRPNYKKMFMDKDAVPYFTFYGNNYK